MPGGADREPRNQPVRLASPPLLHNRRPEPSSCPAVLCMSMHVVSTHVKNTSPLEPPRAIKERLEADLFAGLGSLWLPRCPPSPLFRKPPCEDALQPPFSSNIIYSSPAVLLLKQAPRRTWDMQGLSNWRRPRRRRQRVIGKSIGNAAEKKKHSSEWNKTNESKANNTRNTEALREGEARKPTGRDS